MLDITAFSDALLDGDVSFLRSLGVRPFRRRDAGAVVQYSGDDAVVYPLGTEGTRPAWALRMPLDYQSGRAWPSRYAGFASTTGAIEAHLPKGITLLDVDDVADVDVALLHRWVPGETVTARVARSRNRADRDRLADLLWPLADLGEALRLGSMVHGDIAPGNIIVQPDGRMVLIDLDRGGFRGVDTLLSPRRRPGYRLPRGGGSPVEEDAFALLVLITSCSILADTDVLLDLGNAGDESHPSLLFSSWDLMDPQRSRLVREIEPQLSELSAGLLELLIAACGGRPDRAPGLLRDAIQQIRRSGPAPDATTADAGFASLGDDVQLAGPVATPPTESTTPEPVPEPESGEELSGSPAEAWWPAPADPAEAKTPASTTNSWGSVYADQSVTAPAHGKQAARAVADIVADIQAAVAIEAAGGGEDRRTARGERRQRQTTDALQQALAANDRQALVRLAMSGELAELGDSDRDELMQVVRALTHDAIRRAVDRDDDGMIVAAVDDAAFRQDEDLDPVFRERVRLARTREQWCDELLAALRNYEADHVTTLIGQAPEGAVLRLPASIREQAERLAEREEARIEAQQALQGREADRLARALGRLGAVQPVWTDHIDPDAVVDLLGEEQIGQRLAAKLAQGELVPEDHWMVDVTIAGGRLPEATRLSGLSPRDVEGVIYRDTGNAQDR